MANLHKRKIVLGITGGIAAYKSAHLTRLLIKQGAEVRVCMTQAACEFVTPMTFQALSGYPVHLDLFDEQAEAAMGHIELARWADTLLIAPATANTLAKIAWGQADNLLTTLCLATEAPLVVAPAMNQQMWSNPRTQQNIAMLHEQGVQILGPDSGFQACGEIGPGRMLEPEETVASLSCEQHQSLAGKRVLITAGPTREAIDPVRYITNRSSGKMGFAIAAAAARAGADVTLVAGPVSLSTPTGVHRDDVESARQMYESVQQHIADQDIFIATAAVADYAPAETADHKIKKKHAAMRIDLAKTDDILAAFSTHHAGLFSVGFAAETQNLEEYARSKMKHKQLDMIAANQVGDRKGFEVDDNALEVYWNGGHQSLPMTTKPCLAEQLVELIARQYHRNKGT